MRSALPRVKNAACSGERGFGTCAILDINANTIDGYSFTALFCRQNEKFPVLGSKMNSHSESRPDRDSTVDPRKWPRVGVLAARCARARARSPGLRGAGGARRHARGEPLVAALAWLGPAPRCRLLPAAAAGLGPSISPVEGRLPGGGRMSKAGYAQVAATEDGEEERPRISGGEAGASVFSRMVFQWVDPAVWEGACRIVLPRRSAGRTS
eukprot:COSAG02_NODE_321_length_24780_cov_11.623962_30_plen_211_part_00